jgi:hypothetical protein
MEASLNTDLVPLYPSHPSNARMVDQFEVHHGIADQMEALAIELRTISNNALEAVPSEATLLGIARKVYSARRKIDDIFGMPGFAVSPAWDIMLDLYMASGKGKQVSVTSACIGAACPSTTALRWLQALESMQLVQRFQDQVDKRRIVVTLTDGAVVKIRQALASYL